MSLQEENQNQIISNLQASLNLSSLGLSPKCMLHVMAAIHVIL